jgi:hypothetical protein
MVLSAVCCQPQCGVGEVGTAPDLPRRGHQDTLIASYDGNSPTQQTGHSKFVSIRELKLY